MLRSWCGSRQSAHGRSQCSELADDYPVGIEGDEAVIADPSTVPASRRGRASTC